MEFLSGQVALPTQALDRFRMNTKPVRSFYGSDIVIKCHRVADLRILLWHNSIRRCQERQEKKARLIEPLPFVIRKALLVQT